MKITFCWLLVIIYQEQEKLTKLKKTNRTKNCEHFCLFHSQEKIYKIIFNNSSNNQRYYTLSPSPLRQWQIQRGRGKSPLPKSNFWVYEREKRKKFKNSTRFSKLFSQNNAVDPPLPCAYLRLLYFSVRSKIAFAWAGSNAIQFYWKRAKLQKKSRIVVDVFAIFLPPCKYPSVPRLLRVYSKNYIWLVTALSYSFIKARQIQIFWRNSSNNCGLFAIFAPTPWK